MNIELIKKEFQALFDCALDDIMTKLKKDGFEVTEDNNHDDGTNYISVDISISNNNNEKINSLFWDMYRKHQLLGKGIIKYDKEGFN